MDLLPREKIIKLGKEKLEDWELLAIMLSTGYKGENVFDLSKRLINTYGLDRLFKMNYRELSKISGIKLSKATKLLATFEITRRIIEHKNYELKLLDAKSVFEYVKAKYLFIDYELLSVIYVDNRIRIIYEEEYTNKENTNVDFPIRNIVKNVIEKNAYGVFLIHNHPAGNLRPSRQDIISTKALIETLKNINSILIDHLIIAKNNYCFP